MIDNRRTTWQARRTGFTLVELLVVMLIILLVSALTLPAIISAISHRQVSEAARILQAALVGARDSAIHNNAISGIRLLPDPTLNGIDPTTGALNSALPLAMNRIVPLEAAPDYDEGFISIIQDVVTPFTNPQWGQFVYPYPTLGSVKVLMVEECPVNPSPTNFLANEPTSWFWNIRIGDKIRIGNSGQYYTVIGPMTQANPELFVNDGPAGNSSQLSRTYNNTVTGASTGAVPVEYLFLVNGRDDDADGFIDNGWDGVDNDVNGIVDDFANEWTESETWLGALTSSLSALNLPGSPAPPYTVPPAPWVHPPITFPVGTLQTQGILNQPYTITRRPAPSSGSREVALPSKVVIDLTTWGGTISGGVTFPPERSRFPLPPAVNGVVPLGESQAVNPNSGSVDILVNPDGTVVPSTIYSTPSSFGLNGAFLHFWLAERSDVIGPDPNRTAAPFLPLPAGLAPSLMTGGAEIKGDVSLVTVYSRTGQILVNSPPRFDSFANPANGTAYNVNIPFLDAQQGVTGGNR